MFKLFMRLHGWITFIPLFMGALGLMASTGISDREAALDENGVTVDAQIIGMRTYTRHSTSNNSTTTVYEVRFHFPVPDSPDGPLHYETVDVSSDFYESLEINTSAPVRYLPENPDINEFEPGALSENSTAALIVGVVFVLCSLAGVAFVLRKAMRMRAIGRNGAQATATVTGIVNHTNNHKLKFTYKDRAGVEREGATMPGSLKRIAGVEEGDTIQVRYNPDAPEKNVYWERDLCL